MKKKLEIYLLIVRSLVVDCANKAWAKLVTLKETVSGDSRIKQETTRVFLLGRHRAANMEGHQKFRVSAVGGTIIAVILVFSLITSAQVFSVSVNGQLVGYVNERADYAHLVSNIKEKISRENGNPEIFIKEADIELKPAIRHDSMAVFSAQEQEEDVVPVVPEELEQTAPAAEISRGIEPLLGTQDQTVQENNNDQSGDTIIDATVPLSDAPADAGLAEVPKTESVGLEDALIDTLIREDSIKATVYNIEVNGQPVATLATMKDASDVLQNVANAYKVDLQDAKAGFIDDVQIIGETVDLNSVQIKSTDTVTDMFLTGVDNSKTYVANDSDTAEQIAYALGITEEELRMLYPDDEFVLINEGDIYEYVDIIPYLRYETSGYEEVDLPIPFETVEKRTNTLYYGETEVEVEGEEGLRHVKRSVTRINGEIVAAEEFSSEILKEPSQETILTGTLLVPGDIGFKSDTGSGKLGRPLDSWSFSRGVSGSHMGDDLLAPQGTPIYAAESGTVVFAGWFSAYGLLVRVSHGNGLETYYSHCDTINVAEGQVVERGQQIATVGITGRATAFHLHFEVRVNGVAQEPLDWMG